MKIYLSKQEIIKKFNLPSDSEVCIEETIEESKPKVFIPDTSHLVGKTLEEVKDYVNKITHCKPLRFLTDEEWKNGDLIPKDGNYYFNFGSLVRDSDGDEGVPYASWVGSEWSRRGGWLSGSWDSDFRVLLLEI